MLMLVPEMRLSLRRHRCLYTKCLSVIKDNTHQCVLFLIFVGPRSILWCHWLLLFWTLYDPPHGFQSQGGCTLTCLHMVNLRVMSGVTSGFLTNKGVHWISVYTADSPSRHLSCKQQREGIGGLLTWAALRVDLVLAHSTHQCYLQ